MSGTFNDEQHGEINVPPTWYPSPWTWPATKDIITGVKRPGSKIVVFAIEKDEYDLPKYDRIMEATESCARTSRRAGSFPPTRWSATAWQRR